MVHRQACQAETDVFDSKTWSKHIGWRRLTQTLPSNSPQGSSSFPGEKIFLRGVAKVISKVGGAGKHGTLLVPWMRQVFLHLPVQDGSTHTTPACMLPLAILPLRIKKTGLVSSTPMLDP